ATNNGPANATLLHVDDPIPLTGITFLNSVPSSGTTFNKSTGDWNIGNLTATRSVTLQLTFQVTSVNPYTNVATVHLPTVEPAINHDNNSGQATITPKPQADVAMAKTVDNAAPPVGETITFTVTATNNGPSPATGVIVSDPLPQGMTFVPGGNPSQGMYDPA